MNTIFIALIVVAVLTGAFSGNMEAVNKSGIESAKSAVQIAIGLLGMMTLWLGFMRVLREAGVLSALSRLLAPIMQKLFPEIPADHPAMGAMIMNIAANMLGLGNAATPFGLKAMQELDRLNPNKGVATDSMVLFLAINTSGVAVFPTGVIALRASLGAENASGIILPSLLATMGSTLVAILVAKLLAGRFPARPIAAKKDAPGTPTGIAGGVPAATELDADQAAPAPSPPWRALPLLLFLALIGVAAVGACTRAPEGAEFGKQLLSHWLLPVLMGLIVLFGFRRRVKVYEALIEGAREGFQIFVMIIPFLVAILVAVGMLRASGALDWGIALLQPLTSLVGFPAEALPMAMVRPLSGSGALGVMTETMTRYGPDSFVGFLVSVLNGSTETTFYVLALYLGSVQIRAARHALAACLAADAAGVAFALLWCRVFF
ncbi:MAG: nucleoside recognition domain-containing protein [Myxococcota bacterium]